MADSVLGQDVGINTPRPQVGGLEGFEPGGVYNPNDIISKQWMDDYKAAHQAGDAEAVDYLHKQLVQHTAAYSKRAYNPATTGMSPNERVGASFDQTLVRSGQGLANIAHVGPSDAELTAQDKENAPLQATSEGKKGSFAAQIAEQVPLGAATGPLRAALAAGKGLGPSTARVLIRALTAGGENATQAASLADPEHQGEAAELGAGIGGVASLGGSAVSKIAQGVASKSPAARRLLAAAESEGYEGTQIPISQGGTGFWKALYGTALPYALGVGGRLKAQSEAAKDVMSEVAANRAERTEIGPSGELVMPKAKIGQTMEQTAASLKDSYDQAYENTVKGYPFKVPEDFRASVLSNLKDSGLPEAHQAHIATTLDSIIQEHAGKDGVITGANLLRAKAAARDVLGGLRSPGTGAQIGNPASTEHALGSFEDIIQRNIDDLKDPKIPYASKADAVTGAQTIRDLENYQRLKDSYGGARGVIAASEANVRGRGALTGARLAEESPADHPNRLLGQDWHEVLDKENPGSVTPAGRHFLHNAAPFVGGFALGGVPGAAAAGGAYIGGAHLLANPSTQKFLYGDYAKQQLISKMLREHPDAAYALGQTGRAGVTDAAR